MTSLTGFDALLRGKRVVTHGLPFYAGWGLTTDTEQDAPALRIARAPKPKPGAFRRMADLRERGQQHESGGQTQNELPSKMHAPRMRRTAARQRQAGVW